MLKPVFECRQRVVIPRAQAARRSLEPLGLLSLVFLRNFCARARTFGVISTSSSSLMNSSGLLEREPDRRRHDQLLVGAGARTVRSAFLPLSGVHDEIVVACVDADDLAM